MSNKKQSSVEWLVDNLNGVDCGESYDYCKSIIEQAKAMHKEEIENSYDYMRCIGSFSNGKEYYNGTFGGDNE